MLEYDLITRDQPSSGGWVKLFSMYQNYKGVVDWHENLIKFRLYQAGGNSSYTEKNYYLSTFKGNNSENKIQFYDLDSIKGAIQCKYLLTDGVIDVYAKGARSGVPIKMQILECPCLGRITLYQARGYETLASSVLDKLVEPTVNDPSYDFSNSVNRSGSKFYYDTVPGYKLYREYTVDRYRVIMKDVLTVTNSEFTGENEFLFKIDSSYIPTWAFEEGSNYTEFPQDYSYKPKNEARVYGNKCRVQLYSDGILKVCGMKPMDSTLYSVSLYLNLDYKRTLN